ncbi:hypothetical protein RAA17_18625 [Komagataeibacter rhaeticus]|nr:hypothetical protein [Komagataeibacter rhaeticus]
MVAGHDAPWRGRSAGGPDAAVVPPRAPHAGPVRAWPRNPSVRKGQP